MLPIAHFYNVSILNAVIFVFNPVIFLVNRRTQDLMYNKPPPVDALSWPLGLIRDLCVELGIGKDAPDGVRWTDAELSNRMGKTMTRNWWEQLPPKMVLMNFIEIVTEGEAYGDLWRYVIENAEARTGKRKKVRSRVFRIKAYTKKSIREKVVPRLNRMTDLTEEIKEQHIESRDRVLSIFRLKTLFYNYWLRVLGIFLIAGVALGSFLTLPTLNSELALRNSNYGQFFTNIMFCSDEQFEYRPDNTCKKDVRTFSSDVTKINLSFTASQEIRPGTPFTLKWFKDSEFQFERERPWSTTFAFELKKASTHVQMKKFENLPSDWSDPGLYQVQFFLDGKIKDEAFFQIHH